MAEWLIAFEDKSADDLNEDLGQGPIIDDNGALSNGASC